MRIDKSGAMSFDKFMQRKKELFVEYGETDERKFLEELNAMKTNGVITEIPKHVMPFLKNMNGLSDCCVFLALETSVCDSGTMSAVLESWHLPHMLTVQRLGKVVKSLELMKNPKIYTDGTVLEIYDDARSMVIQTGSKVDHYTSPAKNYMEKKVSGMFEAYEVARDFSDSDASVSLNWSAINSSKSMAGQFTGECLFRLKSNSNGTFCGVFDPHHCKDEWNDRVGDQSVDCDGEASEFEAVFDVKYLSKMMPSQNYTFHVYKHGPKNGVIFAYMDPVKVKVPQKDGKTKVEEVDMQFYYVISYGRSS